MSLQKVKNMDYIDQNQKLLRNATTNVNRNRADLLKLGEQILLKNLVLVPNKSRKIIKSQDKSKDKRESTDKFEEVYGKDI
jgi:hypothetical protein